MQFVGANSETRVLYRDLRTPVSLRTHIKDNLD